jgi:short-subunit dehydrogenase
MVDRAHGTLVSIATNLVFSGTAEGAQLPKRAVYAATKAFLFTLVRLLGIELQGSGVRLQVVCPGLVRTEFHTRQNIDMSQRPRMEPEDVVAASLRGLELGELVCIPGLEETEKLDRRDEAERDLMAAGMRAQLAGRYV